MKKILVVDDDATLREMICEVLSDEGFDVHAVADAIQAMDYLDRLQPDLIITDVMMPVLDGGVFASVVQVRYGERAAPVLGMTALSRLTRATDNGFHSVIYKPFDLDALLEAVNGVLGERAPAASPRGHSAS